MLTKNKILMLAVMAVGLVRGTECLKGIRSLQPKELNLFSIIKGYAQKEANNHTTAAGQPAISKNKGVRFADIADPN